MSELAPRVEKTETGNYRIYRYGGLAAFVILMADGSGWRVRTNTSSRRGQIKSWLSPRQSFVAYYGRGPWAKKIAAQLPDDDYRQAWIDKQGAD